jgi:hypothetical protein
MMFKTLQTMIMPELPSPMAREPSAWYGRAPADS